MTPIWSASAPKGLLISAAAISFAASLALALVEPTTPSLVTVGFVVGLFAPFILLFSRYRIEVLEDRVRYRSPLTGTRELTFQEIAISRVVVGNGTFKPEWSLVVTPRKGVAKKPLFIAISVFRTVDISQLVQFPELRYASDELEVPAGV